jgi:hypothetical protein
MCVFVVFTCMADDGQGVDWKSHTNIHTRIHTYIHVYKMAGLIIYLGFLGMLAWQMMGRGLNGKVGRKAEPDQLDKSLSFDDIAGIDEAKNRVCMCVCMSLCVCMYVCRGKGRAGSAG